MNRTALILSLLLGAAVGAQEAPRRVAVFPFQAVSGDVPLRAGPRVTARLATEVRAFESLALVEPPSAEPPPDPLVQARAAVKEAEDRRQKRDFAGADVSIGQALDAYATAAAPLSSRAEIAEAYALRAAVRYAMGRDEEAARALAFALALSPERPLSLAATSPLFARTVERVRAALREQPRGAVRFSSVPPGVAVTLDGHTVGPAPVRMTAVPPGAHLWRAVLPSGETVGGLVEVVSGKEAEVTVLPVGKGPDAALATALANNRLDAAAIDAAVAAGQALRADLVVLGTLARMDTGVALDAFVLTPGARTLRRVPRIALDTELLEAGTPLRELSAAISFGGAQTGEPVSLPVTPSPGAAPVPRPTQVAYPVEEKPASAPKPTPPAPDRPPLAPRKPLIRP